MWAPFLFQSCQKDGDKAYVIANAGTEEMWIDEDGVVFLYYVGSDNRWLCNVLKFFGAWWVIGCLSIFFFAVLVAVDYETHQQLIL